IQKRNDEAHALETALECFVTTALRLRGRSLATMPPAPKVIAMYYPQFHQVPELEKFFGDGYTDWKALQDFKGDGLRKPLSEERGGLGFYDLMKRQVRGKQANLAKQHGVHGFSYYHYWFGGEGGHNKSVMWKVPYQVLHDGQPNLPYFFTWANEPWTRKFSGQAGEDVLIPQTPLVAKWGLAACCFLPTLQHFVETLNIDLRGLGNRAREMVKRQVTNPSKRKGWMRRRLRELHFEEEEVPEDLQLVAATRNRPSGGVRRGRHAEGQRADAAPAGAPLLRESAVLASFFRVQMDHLAHGVAKRTGGPLTRGDVICNSHRTKLSKYALDAAPAARTPFIEEQTADFITSILAYFRKGRRSDYGDNPSNRRLHHIHPRIIPSELADIRAKIMAMIQNGSFKTLSLPLDNRRPIINRTQIKTRFQNTGIFDQWSSHADGADPIEAVLGHEVAEEEAIRRDIHGNDWKVALTPHEGRSRDAMIEADWGSNKCKDPLPKALRDTAREVAEKSGTAAASLVA
ncbi:wxcX, partial [Symbiodinium sp. CCMP2456]